MTDDMKRIAAYLKLFVSDDAITELRAFGPTGQILSGTFSGNNLEGMARAAAEMRGFRGVYFVPNPINNNNRPPTNEIKPAGKTTADIDIAERRWILIDVDPVRPSDTSATDDERREAWRVLCNVQSAMESAGFRGPIVACSGNGWHLSYPIARANDEIATNEIKALLAGLDQRCSSAGARVDTKTYNASRIWKLYGTTARKGVETAERPHRVAFVTAAPERAAIDAARNNNTPAAIRRLLAAWATQDSALAAIESQRGQPDSVKRAAAYLANVPPAVSGSGGHSHCYHVAMILVDGFGLSPDEAAAAIGPWNARCQPPWTDSELNHKFRDAARNAGPNRGHLLAQNAPPRPATGRTAQLPARTQYTGPDAVAAPEIETDDPDATAVDLLRVQATVQWAWPGWIQRGTITAIASDPGIGKTRFCADLLRRIHLGLPWPDGTPPTFPIGTVAVWIAADSQWSELTSLPNEMEFPPEALVLNGRRSNPYAGTNLDTVEDLAEFERRLRRVQPGLVFVDTCGSATDRNTTRPEEAKQFFKPLAEIATRTNCAIVLVTHLSKSGEALGRRIVGACRQVIKLEQPNPDGEPNRRRLWVDKTNAKKPEPLGITMGDKNEYDNNPPLSAAMAGNDEPGRQPARPRGRPSKLAEDTAWLIECLALGNRRVKTVIDDAGTAGISIDRVYRAMRAAPVEESEIDGKKWWSLISDIDESVECEAIE